MPIQTPEGVTVLGVADNPDLIELSAGMYADATNDNVLIVHLTEVVVALCLDDTQETRATIYGTWRKFCEANGIELVLVRDPNAPSVHDSRT